MSLQVGDKVKVTKVVAPEDSQVVGRVGIITRIREGSEYPYYVSNMPSDTWSFKPSQLEVIKKKEETVSSSKLYRVTKDHPVWEEGAVLRNEDGDGYQAIDDLFVKDIKDLDEPYVESATVVENASEWFERVYEVSYLKKVKYLSKAAARKASTELYKSK